MAIHRDGENVWRVDPDKEGIITSECREFVDEVPLHWHSFYEVEIILGGRGVHTLNGKSVTVGEGSAYILTPTDFHTVRATEPMRLWNVSIPEEYLSVKRVSALSSDGAKNEFTLDEVTTRRLSAIAELLSEEGAVPSDRSCARELCESLFCILARQSGATAARKEYAKDEGIDRALLYLNVHFRENPSLSAVAAQAGFHPHYFSQLFKRVTGKNFVTKLNELKIGYAKRLLTAGLSVSEACYQSGFGSPSNFLSVFKRSTGTSPEEYKCRKRGKG